MWEEGNITNNDMKLLLHKAASLSRMGLGVCLSRSCVYILVPEVEKAIAVFMLIVQGLGMFSTTEIGELPQQG